MRAVLGAARLHAQLRRALEQEPIQHLRTAAARSNISLRHGGSHLAFLRLYVAARNTLVLSRDRLTKTEHEDLPRERAGFGLGRVLTGEPSGLLSMLRNSSGDRICAIGAYFIIHAMGFSASQPCVMTRIAGRPSPRNRCAQATARESQEPGEQTLRLGSRDTWGVGGCADLEEVAHVVQQLLRRLVTRTSTMSSNERITAPRRALSARSRLAGLAVAAPLRRPCRAARCRWACGRASAGSASRRSCAQSRGILL